VWRALIQRRRHVVGGLRLFQTLLNTHQARFQVFDLLLLRQQDCVHLLQVMLHVHEGFLRRNEVGVVIR
jgi:hypothetical protein